MKPSDHGRFCWFDLMTTDPAGSLKFYQELFGWRVDTVPMGDQQYDMLFMDDRPLGGVVPMNADDGIPTHWIPYVAVNNIEDTCRCAQDNGATVCVPPTDIGPGMFAILNDPQGGVISTWQTQEDLLPTPGKDEVGLFCWSECMSTNAEAGAKFYQALFGWSGETMNMAVGGQDMPYHVFFQNKEHHAGMMDLPAEAVAQGASTHWLNYVNVEDVDVAAEKAASLGATLLCPATDIPHTGRFCVIQDPQGGMVALFTHKETETA